MKHLFSIKSVAAMAAVLGSITMASTAHARGEVYISVDVPVPGIRLQHAPVFSQPRHVVQGVPGHLHQLNGRQDHWRHRHGLFGPYGDLDRDGIKNRYDRDRDGDGIPNRYDRRPDHPRGW